MDIFAHALWTGATAKVVNIKNRRRILSVLHSAVWGVFPDFFAFTILFTWFFWEKIFGNPADAVLPRPEQLEPIGRDGEQMLNLAADLYNYSHSIVIFTAVFGIVWFIFQRPILPLFGWLFHVLVDIPTHSADFYPTPIFWPISKWHVGGIFWADPNFMVINYTALAAVYFLILRSHIKAKRYVAVQNNKKVKPEPSAFGSNADSQRYS